ncbi:TonB-dependent receptor [Pseudoalteromonas sp. Z9A5]|uniref:TonB-dependent receptor domain-containing protein n=1 Tax=Pseudoalteromonas sp. Z9A5 TaxID=2686355 RepID=UPI00140BE1D2|nr:TonB-dependent receptor [Pseudoalteromonas sp. Z9A5]
MSKRSMSKLVPLTCKKLPLAILIPIAMSASAAEKTNEMETMVVTATGYQQKIIDAPASISVILQEELRKQSYTTVVDAVRDIPGVYVTGGGNMQDISIRGMDDQYTLYLVDGRPLSAGRSVNTNGSDGGKQIGIPPLAMIERVEVIRGPMSSLYGSEAMGGVINIITRTAPQQWAASLAASYTSSMNDVSNDQYNTDFYAGGALIKDVLGMELTGSIQHTDESDYSGGGDATASRPDSDTTQFGVKFNWAVDDKNKVSLAYDTSNIDFEHTPGNSIAIDAEGSQYEFEKQMYSLTHMGNYGKLTTNTYLQQDLSERVQDEDKKEEIITFNTSATYAAEQHIYTVGARYKTEELVDETNGLLDANVAIASDTVDRWIGALFTEVEWNFIKDLSITTGLRYDNDEQFGSHWSPRIYANWHANNRFTVKGGVSTGYTQPSLSQATAGFGRGTGGGGSPNLSSTGTSISRALIIGNPDLDPETSVNYEVSFIYNDPKIGLSTSLTFYHTDFDDKIAEDRYCISENIDRNDFENYQCEFSGNTYQFLSTQKNISEAEMQGVEATVNYRIADNLRFKADYSFTDSEQKSGDFAGEPLNKIPKSMANATLNWDASDTINLWSRVNYRGETTDYLSRTSLSDGTPGYTMMDIGAQYWMTDNLKVMAGLYNVTDRVVTNETYGVVLDGRRLTVSFNFEF